MQPRAQVITVSDRVSAGLRTDASGPVAQAALAGAGFDCAPIQVVPDGAAPVAAALREAVSAGAALVLTTGGTGVSVRDQTPEGTSQVLTRILPGISEELRRQGSQDNPAAMLSRGLAGTVEQTLIVNLPGSPKAVQAGVAVVLQVAEHVLDQLRGGDHG